MNMSKRKYDIVESHTDPRKLKLVESMRRDLLDILPCIVGNAADRTTLQRWEPRVTVLRELFKACLQLRKAACVVTLDHLERIRGNK